MILAINIGNTNLWLGLQVNTQIKSCRILIIKCKTSQDIEQKILAFLEEEGITVNIISDCIISSTMPEKNTLVMDAVQSLFSIRATLVTSEMDFGMEISYDKTLIGTDRLLCCMAASTRFPLPLIVYDLGTATTANIVTEGNIFQGGAILPGVDTGLNALTKNTAMLPRVVPAATIPLIGRNTNECLLSGAIFGTAGFIDDYTERINTALVSHTTIIITGGNAPKIIPYLKKEFNYCPDLLLEGLYLLYSRLHPV